MHASSWILSSAPPMCIGAAADGTIKSYSSLSITHCHHRFIPSSSCMTLFEQCVRAIKITYKRVCISERRFGKRLVNVHRSRVKSKARIQMNTGIDRSHKGLTVYSRKPSTASYSDCPFRQRGCGRASLRVWARCCDPVR